MGLTVKMDPIERDVALIFAEELSPEARSKQLAGFARTALGEAEEQNRQALGRPTPHQTFVDGRKDAALESVRPDGVIVFEFDLLDDIFVWIGAMLVEHSPVLSGTYARSHVFFADGVVVEPGAPLPAASEYVFLNVQPYARKIERGYSPQAPDGVYQGVATMAARRFGNLANIRFSYRSPLLGYVAMGGRKAGRMAGAAKRSAAAMEKESRTPAIVINMR